jgi:hypothetical protein
MKRYESKYNPAVKDISDYIHNKAFDTDIPPDVLARITRVLDGVERMDEMISQKEQLLVQKDGVIKQKTVELQSKSNLLVQKEQLLSQKEIEKEHAVRSKSVEKNNLLAQKEKEKKELLSNKEKQLKELETFRNDNLTKELIEVLPQVYRKYNKPFEQWDPTLWGKKAINKKHFKSIESKLPGLKQQAKEQSVKKELIDVLNKLNPVLYPDNFNNWVNSETRKVIESNNYQAMSKLLILNKERLDFKQSQELEQLKGLKEENLSQNKIIEDLTKKVALQEVKIEELSHIDFGIQMTGNELSTQVFEMDLAGQIEPQNL